MLPAVHWSHASQSAIVIFTLPSFCACKMQFVIRHPLLRATNCGVELLKSLHKLPVAQLITVFYFVQMTWFIIVIHRSTSFVRENWARPRFPQSLSVWNISKPWKRVKRKCFFRIFSDKNWGQFLNWLSLVMHQMFMLCLFSVLLKSEI